MDWGAIIAAGVGIAGQLLEDDEREDERADSRENLILQLQDNERDRAAQLERQQIASQASLDAARMGFEAQKKRILGDVLLEQGKGQENLMLENFRASANAPERFNNAASILAQVLSR